MADYLTAQGDQVWMQRDAEAALGFFTLARQYLQKSGSLRYRHARTKVYRNQVERLDRKISFLEEAGIVADLPADIPPVSELTN